LIPEAQVYDRFGQYSDNLANSGEAGTPARPTRSEPRVRFLRIRFGAAAIKVAERQLSGHLADSSPAVRLNASPAAQPNVALTSNASSLTLKSVTAHEKSHR